VPTGLVTVTALKNGRIKTYIVVAEHRFRRYYFKTFTWCSYCKEFIWGVHTKQGWKCTGPWPRLAPLAWRYVSIPQD